MAFISADEELGKRDDDYKYSKKVTPVASWQHRQAPMRRSIKRIVVGLGILVLVYVFIKNMPTDVQQRRGLRPQYGGIPKADTAGQSGILDDSAKPQRPSQHSASTLEEAQEYDGPIRFYELAATLQASSDKTNGASKFNNNLLFAAANAKSAANLIPFACEMASAKRNTVHFAMLGKDDISMEMLKNVNSVDKDCEITFHDARCDYPDISTEPRMQNAAFAALGHIERFLHPQVVVIDGSGIEEVSFVQGFQDRVANMDSALIELPKNAAQNLLWFTRLDTWSLKAWDKISIDIVVHAPSDGSGSLMRLLRSLQKADYFFSTPPRLTVELPQKVDAATKLFLEGYHWPPKHQHERHQNMLTLHHRIPQRGLSSEENSLRVVESFWPADPYNSHVLVLSPHVEVSPLYFQYLKYALLEYHYSQNAFSSTTKLMGLSLTLPTTYLNDTTDFVPPSKDSFLWQAPNSNAALYYGTVWTELHSLTGHSIKALHTLGTPTTLNVKHVSKTYPSWLEHILTLARLRGYSMLYPQLSSDEALATVHNDLYQAPEEYSYAINPDHEQLAADEPLPDLTATFLSAPQDHLSLTHDESTLARKNLLDVLSPDSHLPFASSLARLAWDGASVADAADMEVQANAFASIFKREVGGCSVGEQPPEAVPGEVRDMFCIDRDEDDANSPLIPNGRNAKPASGGSAEDKASGTKADAPRADADAGNTADKSVEEVNASTQEKRTTENGDKIADFTDTGVPVLVEPWKQRYVHGQDRQADTDPDAPPIIRKGLKKNS